MVVSQGRGEFGRLAETMSNPKYGNNPDDYEDDDVYAAKVFSFRKFYEISNPRLLLAAGFVLMGCLFCGFLEPIYAIHAAEDLSLSPMAIGGMYFVLAGSYCLSAAPLGLLSDKSGIVFGFEASSLNVVSVCTVLNHLQRRS